jgi:hypothetical protein
MNPAFRPDYLPVALRVHAVRQSHLERDPDAIKWRPPTMRELPRRTLVIDCETTTDETQRLRFGVWRLYVDGQDAQPGTVCLEEGVFFADDLSDTEPAAIDMLRAYASRHRADVTRGYRTRLRLLSRTDFVEQILWKYAYRQQATIVGFNLPFDLTRLATLAAPARGRNSGGISLRLWEH